MTILEFKCGNDTVIGTVINNIFCKEFRAHFAQCDKRILTTKKPFYTKRIDSNTYKVCMKFNGKRYIRTYNNEHQPIQ